MIVEDLSQYWIRIEEKEGAVWRVAGLRELAPAENAGNHHVYVDVLGPQGEDLRSTGVMVAYGWEGMREDETPLLVMTDKPQGEHSCNIPMFPKMMVWVEVHGELSDRVVGLRMDYVRPDDAEGRGWGTRSFLVTFQKEALG